MTRIITWKRIIKTSKIRIGEGIAHGGNITKKYGNSITRYSSGREDDDSVKLREIRPS